MRAYIALAVLKSLCMFQNLVVESVKVFFIPFFPIYFAFQIYKGKQCAFKFYCTFKKISVLFNYIQSHFFFIVFCIVK